MITPPPCADCGSPAVEQVYVGTQVTPGPPMRRYEWACEPCGREARIERESARRG